MTVYNSAGEQVYASNQPLWFQQSMTGIQIIGSPLFVPDDGGLVTIAVLGTGANAFWAGRNAQGQFVASGIYTIELVENAANAPGLPSVKGTVQVTVLRAPLSGTIQVYNSAGEQVRHLTGISGTADFLRLSAKAFVPGLQSLRVQWNADAADYWIWDGETDSQVRAKPGVYEIVASTQVAGQNLEVKTAFVQVLATPGTLTEGACVVPEPVRPGTLFLTLVLPNGGTSTRVALRMYTLSGNLVTSSSGTGARMEWAIPGILAPGIYLVAVEAQDPGQASVERKILKIAVLR
jgi:hypothetical protein